MKPLFNIKVETKDKDLSAPTARFLLDYVIYEFR